MNADEILKQDKVKCLDIDENAPNGQEYIDAICEALAKLGYFLKPSELFGQVANRRASV